MLPRQDTVEIFSTFIQFDYDRFAGWATDTRLRRSMRQSLSTIATVNSANFWALYWHQIWQQQPTGLAREHLTAYLQEVCFWSATKTISGFNSSQYSVPDCFQVAIARIDKVLKGFDRERGFNLKSYASITFANLIRELLRQQKEIDICSDWSLLRKLSQKRMIEALANAGLDRETTEQYVLAWNCLQTIYVPERASPTRQLPKPQPETWLAIANLYNQERHLQLPSTEAVTCERLEKWLLICVKAVRSYLFPNVASINQSKTGYDTGEIVDSLVGVDQSPLVNMIAQEEIEQRTQQHTDINQFLTAIIKQLKPEEQKLLEFYYALGLKQAEIAQELNTKQYSVSRKLSRVRKELLLALAEWSQSTMHISLTSNILDNISSLLEEWLASYYDSN
ncbi:MAG: sigma-70 family RNA polymerase sigma factor [Pleurocapsa sp. SU_5_0]|nr:sigma-70 family RNA polymerase sigma factor [Pleurocapsa sp. SU_5_0]NJO95631.1 sigma-70 family RNA polymerase sigma factor [Pleurocapsa sp. CRU_1_2]NJR45218.1 sigma-70 family RNA polymerase sigma factor [Hyellaceae cyanobacterium CSU_1_1]